MASPDSWRFHVSRIPPHHAGASDVHSSAVPNPPLNRLNPALDLRYINFNGQDLEKPRRNPLESDQGTGTGPDGSGPRRLPAQASDMLAWAQENGWLIAPDDLAERIGLMQEVPSGDKHEIWGDELIQRAINLTKDANGILAFVADRTVV
jgi:hypothetical protein